MLSVCHVWCQYCSVSLSGHCISWYRAGGRKQMLDESMSPKALCTYCTVHHVIGIGGDPTFFHSSFFSRRCPSVAKRWTMIFLIITYCMTQGLVWRLHAHNEIKDVTSLMSLCAWSRHTRTSSRRQPHTHADETACGGVLHVVVCTCAQ